MIWVLVSLLASAAFALPSDIKLTDIKTGSLYLPPSKGNEFVLLWATWCDSCKKHLLDMPSLNAKIITVNIDDSVDRARAYIKKEGIKIPVYRTQKNEILSRFEIYAVPYWRAYRDSVEIGRGTGFDLDEIRKVLK